MSRRNLPPTHSATTPHMSDHDKSCRTGRTAKPNLTPAEINHLRRLLGWVRCEIGQTPEEYVSILQKVAAMLGHPPLKEDRQDEIRNGYLKSHAVPKYVRAAVTALEKLLVKQEGVVIDVPSGEKREPPEPLLGRTQPALSNSANPSGDESLGIESTPLSSSTPWAEVSDTTQALIDLLVKRDQAGRRKYGTTLDRNDLDLSAWLQHMAEELLDGAGYALAARRVHGGCRPEAASQSGSECDGE